MARSRTVVNDYSEGFGILDTCSECGADLMNSSEIATGFCNYCSELAYDGTDEYEDDLYDDEFGEDFSVEWADRY